MSSKSSNLAMADTAAQSFPKNNENPLSLIPVSLREASYDSPTFRASAIYFSDQVASIERWLDAYIKSISKLMSDASTMEDTFNSILLRSLPLTSASEVVIDHDHTLLAINIFQGSSKEWWSQLISSVKRMDNLVIEPIKAFINKDLRAFKDARKCLEQTQKGFDQTLARYAGQSKTKAPSALREDAFQVYEARKDYLKASLEFCMLVQQLRYAIDTLLIRISYDQWREMKRSCENVSLSFNTVRHEMERIRGWRKEIDNGEAVFRRELQLAKQEIAEQVSELSKPSREIEDYNLSTVAYLGSRIPPLRDTEASSENFKKSEKQGWLFVKTTSGKPARTNWIRRWFYVKDGLFGWLVHSTHLGGVEEPGRLGVLLCSIKPVVQEDRRFCFEVKTKNQALLLQAETHYQLNEWLRVFELAKKKTLLPIADNCSHENLDSVYWMAPSLTSDNGVRNFDYHTGNLNDEIIGTDQLNPQSTSGPDIINHPRTSTIDVLAQRLALNTKEDGESGKEHTTRIISRLDLTRKSATPPTEQSNTNMSSTSSGIASLISSSHNIIPIPTKQNGLNIHIRPSLKDTENYSCTLAPNTLAIAPVPTSLSKKAVLIKSECDTGAGHEYGSGISSVVMANFWGSSSWEYINRLQKPEFKYKNSQNSKISTLGMENHSKSLNSLPEDSHKPEFKNEGNSESSHNTPGASSGNPSAENSQDSTTGVDQESAKSQNTVLTGRDSAPINYPLELKAHDAQLRILFPHASKEDKVLLVFRAIWNPNEQQEFPGRVYVTQRNIFFYSHHFGFVLTTRIGMDNISEVTAAPGKDCDFIFLHIRRDMQEKLSRITIKTFMEPLRLLQARLNYLIDNSQGDISIGFESTVATLIEMEDERNLSRSPSWESWENISINTPIDNAIDFAQTSINHKTSKSTGERAEKRKTRKEIARLHLPSQPTIYEPSDTPNKVIEQQFNVGPKALFHAIFGDKSSMFQLLYVKRGAEKILQGPWHPLEQDQMRRDFEFQIKQSDFFFQSRQITLMDQQTIDIKNDHLCYVVSYSNILWHLPYYTNFKLIIKMIITHVAKSKCKLTIYTKVDWVRKPFFFGRFVERQAIADSILLTQYLADGIADQVHKLGPHSRTKKSLNIFGQVGQQRSTSSFSVPDLIHYQKNHFKQRKISRIVFQNIASLTSYIVMSLMIIIFSIFKLFRRIISAHQIIFAALMLSLVINVFFLARDGSDWWAERKATRFMSRMGVGPNRTTSKVIYLKDLNEALKSDPNEELEHSNSKCYNHFKLISNVNSFDFTNTLTKNALFDKSTKSTKSTAQRLRRKRQQLGSYRHDILIAMRLINRIETEVLRTEWENWLLDENLRCKKLSLFLREKSNNFSLSNRSRLFPDTSRLSTEKDSPQRGDIKVLQKWKEDYCESCALEQESLVKKRKHQFN